LIAIQWDSKKLELTLKGTSDALKDLRPIWGDIDAIFRAFMRQVFASEGSYGGSRWKPLNTAYAARKQRQWGTKPILQRTGLLMHSFVSANDVDHVYRVGPTFGEFGSRKIYAKPHQYGAPSIRLPARPMIRKFTKAEGERVVDALLAHIFREAARAL
jgi:phage gpG-like protein